jgi:hypothetical protein
MGTRSFVARAPCLSVVGLFGVAIGGGMATSSLHYHTARHLAIACARASVFFGRDVRRLIWGDTHSRPVHGFESVGSAI